MADLRIDALQEGQEQQGDIAIVQSGQTKKVEVGTAIYKNTGTSSGNVPVLDSNGKLPQSTYNTGGAGGIPNDNSVTIPKISATGRGANKVLSINGSNNAMTWVNQNTTPANNSVGLAQINASGRAANRFLRINNTNNEVEWSADTLNISGSHDVNKVVGSTGSGLEYQTVGTNKFNASNTPSTNDVPVKSSGNDQVTWQKIGANQLSDNAVTEPKLSISNTGSAGEFLKKTSSGMEWDSVTAGTPADNSITTAKINDEAVTEPKLAISNTGTTGQVLKKTSNGMQWANDNDTTTPADNSVTAAKLNSSLTLDDIPDGTTNLKVYKWSQFKSANKVIPEGTVLTYNDRLYLVKTDIATNNSTVRNSNPENLALATYFEPTHLQDTVMQLDGQERQFILGVQNDGDHKEANLLINLDVANNNSQKTLAINETHGVALYTPTSSTQMDFKNSSTFTPKPIIELEGTNNVPTSYTLENVRTDEKEISTGYSLTTSNTLSAGDVKYTASSRTLVIKEVAGQGYKLAGMFQQDMKVRIEKDATNYIEGVVSSITNSSGTHTITLRDDDDSVVGTIANDDTVKLKSFGSVLSNSAQLITANYKDNSVTEDKLNISNAGSNNQYLQKTSTGMQWATVSGGSGGTPDDDSVSTAKIQDEAVTEAKLNISNAGSTGNVLKKTSNGMEWASVSSGSGGFSEDVIFNTSITNSSSTNRDLISGKTFSGYNLYHFDVSDSSGNYEYAPFVILGDKLNNLGNNYTIYSPISNASQINIQKIDNNTFRFGASNNTITLDRIIGITITSGGTPANDSLTTAMLKDESVTEPKLNISNAGSNGQVLSKSSSGLTWVNQSSGGGTPDDDSVATAKIQDEAVTEPKLAISNTGSAGQFLKKTSTGMEWVMITTQQLLLITAYLLLKFKTTQ